MTTATYDQGGTPVRWGVCLLVILGLHAGAGWLLLRHVPFGAEPPAAPEAVLLELPPAPATAPAAPALPPMEDAAPAPAPPVAQPSAVPIAVPPPPPEQMAPPELAPAPVPEPPLAEMPPPLPEMALPTPPLPMPVPVPSAPPVHRPAPRPVTPRPVPRPAPAPSPAAVAPPQAAPVMPAAPVAPPAAAPAASSNAVPNWRGQISARLQRFKRYPDAARSRGDQGVATVSFTMDRAGHVLSASLVRSSGYSSLDEEAVAMIHRADPLPAAPPEEPGATITFPVPVVFSLR